MSDEICGLSDEEAARDELPEEGRLADAYDKVLSLARAIPPNEVKTFGVDTRLAFWNAREGYKLILPYLDEIRSLPRVDADAIARIPDVAMALLHAVRLISLLVPSKTDIPERLSRARKLRYVMLHQAQAAAGLGLLPEGPVEKIRKGTGALDAIDDLLALATLFDEYRDALANKTVVTDDLLVEAEKLGLSLQEELRPTTAKRQRKEREESLAQAIDDRNRIHTLLATAHAELQRVSGFLGMQVPSLQARRVVKKKKPAQVTEG